VVLKTNPHIIRGALALLVVLSLTGGAVAVEHHFAGSAQLDYLLVPTRDDGRAITLDGFTGELSLKLTADVTEEVSIHVKTCYGCHGFEIGMSFIDVSLHDALTFRVGRFIPSFGDFPVRHDPANHRTSDKPLPYDMGRMLRLRDWNMSVLPAPYVDNGIEIRGHHYGETVDFEYAVSVFGGLRGGRGAMDVDFIQSRSGNLYYVDNNSRPSVAGRLAVGFALGDAGTLKLGASGMYGTYDPDNELDYLLLGGDLTLRLDKFALRAEYLIRRTKMSLGDNPAETFHYGPGADGLYDPYFLKDGWYLETEYSVAEAWTLVGRFDGMRRLGNVPVGSKLRKKSLVFRYTLGVHWRAHTNISLKLSSELYDFSDFSDEAAIHFGVVGQF
jgi:hypothetical protein